MLVPAPSILSARPRELVDALAHVERSETLPRGLVQRLVARFALPRPARSFSPAPYAREVLFAGGSGEAMLATWRAAWPCAPHDHGRARGAVLVVRGRFRERTYRFDGRALVQTGASWVRAGDVVSVEAGAIHDMESADDSGATLHLYAPTPGPTRLYDATRRETLVVDDGVGAWLPAVAALAIEPWGPPHA